MALFRATKCMALFRATKVWYGTKCKPHELHVRKC